MVTFGLQGIPEVPDARSRLSQYAAVLEQLPEEFTTVWVEDHLQFGDSPRAEGWTLATYLAATFPRFTIGHLVLCQSFRNPALLAKMAASLHELTQGRFILGIGAGWHKEEYSAYDYDYPSGGTRVAQLAEAIKLIRAMWTSSPATFHGAHYHVENAYCEPRPDTPIPIMVGTNGPKALRVTAELADWWNWDGPLEGVYRRPLETLQQHCKDIGRPIEDVTLTAGVPVAMPENPDSFEASYTHAYYPGAVFPVLGPTPDNVISELNALIDAGVSHFQVGFEDLHTLHRFTKDVMPGLSST